jgi:hypothetical protein
MRTTLALVFMLSAGSPALACHHYRSWSYPWPQSCRMGSAPAQPRRTWFVEIKPESPPAPATEPDELTRAQALETLKQELRMRSTQALELQTLSLTTGN